MTESPTQFLASQTAGKTVAIVGLGNIGGNLPSMVGRMPAVDRMLLIDGDFYDRSNLTGQNITVSAVGRPKAVVQAEYARSLGRDDLQVVGIDRWVDLVPLGVLAQADLLLAGVDSKATRQAISEIAFRLGIPYLDTGVNTQQATARVTLFDSHRQGACIECPWTESDYAALEARKSCLAPSVRLNNGNGVSPTSAPATAGPGWLGALTAALAATTVAKLFNGDANEQLAGQEVVLEPFSLQSIRATLPRNPRCRFDHKRLDRALLPRPVDELTLGQAFALAAEGDGGKAFSFGLLGIPWATESSCETCGDAPARSLNLLGRTATDTCTGCGAEKTQLGYSAREHLPLSFFNSTELAQPLSHFGFENGDVIQTVSADGTKHHFELPLPATPTSPK